ncbi:MAG: GTPase domain-containing protein [Deltaproteobacteria bacterium]|nr:GTPase domain-containing protein [Deltaproteobacteria bacterium]
MKDKRQTRPESISKSIQDSLAGIAEAAQAYPGLSPEAERIPGLVLDLHKRLAVFAYRLQMRHLWIVFLGGTGTGKSTLFNAFIGKELSRTGVERPKTGGPIAYAPRDAHIERSFPFPGIQPARLSPDDADAVPARGIPDRLLVLEHGRNNTDGWVVVDTPDLDSLEAENRRIAEDFYLLSDVVIFVTSQEKYADEAPYEFLKTIVREKRPCFVVLNKASAETGRSDILNIMKENGISLPPEAFGLIPFGPSLTTDRLSKQAFFINILNHFRETYPPEASASLRKTRRSQSAAEVAAKTGELRKLLQAESRAAAAWRERLTGLHERVWQELLQDEQKRFTEHSRRYLSKEIRKLFGRYDVLAKPRKIIAQALLTPFRMVGLIKGDKRHDPEDALAKIREKADATPMLSAVDRFNRLVLETLPRDRADAPISREIRRERTALDRNAIQELIEKDQVELIAWLEKRFQELADGIPRGKKWGIYSTSILWGILVLSLEVAVGGGFTVLDAVLGSSVAPFLTKGAVELFAYQEIRKVARELSRRYQEGLRSILSLQLERYLACLESLLPSDDLDQALADLPKKLKKTEDSLSRKGAKITKKEKGITKG